MNTNKMASNTHVDSRIAERRLRPIYDWLDSGNNKKALQEAEKVLKKQPNFLCAKVLKALALQRLGREAECEEILEGVCSQVPTDEATLQAITVCYRAIHKPSKICDVYSAASKKDPTNEELLTRLFMSYVRIGDYRKQHQHAMSLYKLKPKNPYYFWAVMSVVMQAKGDENMGKVLALKLAEKMVSKFVTEGKIEAEQEVQLYLMILEMQGKYEEALDVIEGELGEKLKSLVTTDLKKIELLIKLERWKEANVLLKCQLEKNPDSWSDYKNYMKTMLKLHSEYLEMKNNHECDLFDNRVPVRVPASNNGEECILWYEADYTPEMVKMFFNQLTKSAEENKKNIRGPYLAQLELYKVLTNESLRPEIVVGNFIDLLVNYFDKFAEKPICVFDLKPYLSLLSPDSKSLFIKRISEIIGLADGEIAKTIPSLQKQISRLQLSRLLGFHSVLSVEERLKLCNLLLYYYQSSNFLVSPDKLPTEFSCNDPYIILLSHVLYSVYQDTKCRTHLIRAIFHLENALSASPSNFHFKLLLVRFYLLLGAGQQAFHFFDHLETKYIQLDSMGYLIATSGYGLGNFSATAALYDATLKFFFTNTSDSIDHLTYAYKYGSFMKIQEFIEFRDKLNDSLHYTFCTVEKMLHDLLWTSDYTQSEMVVKSMEVKPGIDKTIWSQLRDNRDLNVIVSFEPLDKQLNEKTKQKSFENLKNYVRLRDIIMKCLCACFDFINDADSKQSNDFVQNGDSQCFRSVLVRLVSEMKCLYNELKTQDLDIDIQDVINAPPPCRLKIFLKLPVCQVISDMINILLLTDTPKEDENKLLQYSESVSQSIFTATNLCVSKINIESIQTREVLEELVGLVEMIKITAILSGNLGSYVKKNRKNMKKGKRKKEDDGGNEFFVYKNILKNLSECILLIDETLNKVSDLSSVKVMTNEVEALNVAESTNDFSNIEKKLQESYNSSVQEIRQFLQEKQFYINTLRNAYLVRKYSHIQEVLCICLKYEDLRFLKTFSQFCGNFRSKIIICCYLRSIFSTSKAFHSHKSCCEYYKISTNTNSDLESTTVSGIRIVESKTGSKPEFLIKIMKSSTISIDKELENDTQRTETVPTNLLGRRLPSRTKVPFLSRAIPLSTDHSYESCPCGAVFVTRIGKRQHQARFCKFLKNKSKKWQNGETVAEVCPVTKLSNVSEYIEHKDFSEKMNSLKSGTTSSIIQIKENIQHIPN